MNPLMTFTLCLMAIGLCTLHFWCGYALASSRIRKVRRSASPSAGKVDRLAYQAAVNTLLEQALQVSTLASAGNQQGVDDAISKLGRAASALERSSLSYSFSMAELTGLATQPDGNELESEGAMANERRPYPTWQYVAPYDEAMPDPSTFQDVFCHDISVGGVSYLSAEVPTDLQLCISLGNSPDWLMMEAQVANHRAVEYKGLPMYLVGCRFTRRLGKFKEVWPGKDPAFGQPVSIRPVPSGIRPPEQISQSA
jgi:hypothetical protein